ncbi:hypothetical protein B5G20_06635 [Collinsella sp. An7]|uniref:DUF2142 domain-containing protein n=1 Tax=Collinsella sp. An7 TaxID=1965651 RepID=UPI000B3A3251|nr:DUF2142 domain-containing protein [Collinsella sp. An7]OUN46636.1 hypothetical protein B5G20_06635 [Collinsella sp. An7]
MQEVLESRLDGKAKSTITWVVLGALCVIIYSIYLFSRCDSLVVLLLAIFSGVIALVACFGIWHLMKEDQNFIWFASIFLVLGIAFCFLFPPLAAPDEHYHFMASYWTSDYLIGQASPFDSSSFPVREEDLLIFEKGNDGVANRDSYEWITQSFSWGSNNDALSLVEDYSFDLGSNPFYIKLPSACGILLGRLLGLGAFPTFYLGRLFNLLFVACLITIAIRITPIGKSVFMAVALLPMVLHLSSTYSYDGGVIALAFLFLALILRALKLQHPLTKGELARIAIVGVLVAPCKAVYSALAIFLLLVPSERYGSKKNKVLYCASLILLMCVAIIVLRMPTFLSMASASSIGVERGDSAGVYYSLSDILLHPTRSILMLLRTLFLKADFYWTTLIGSSLGYFQSSIAAPMYLVVGYLLVLIVAAQRSKVDDLVLPASVRLSMIGLSCLAFLGIILSMWLGWTFTTETIIEGVQGRYLLPLLPTILLASRSRAVYIDREADRIALSSLSLLNYIYLYYILMNALIS